jgi:hypothetical protein
MLKNMFMVYGLFSCRPPVYTKKVQLPQAQNVKYLALHLDRRLTLHKHSFSKRKLLGVTLKRLR